MASSSTPVRVAVLVTLIVGGSGAGAESSRDASSSIPNDDFGGLMNRAMERMHVGMHVDLTGDPDRDFVRMMIPHHQGAVDMALVELRYGRDPRLRRLAQAIVVEQKQEIQVMNLYLPASPSRPAGR
jgi:uncharacterized protein (DUF305 family)